MPHMTITVTEVMAGLDFLERYAPPECLRALSFAKAAIRETNETAKREALLDTPLTSLEISVRAHCHLSDLGAKTLREVLTLHEHNLINTSGHKKVAREARELLDNLGLLRRSAP